MSLGSSHSQNPPIIPVGATYVEAIDDALAGAGTDVEVLARIASAFRAILNADEADAFLYDTFRPAPALAPSSAPIADGTPIRALSAADDRMERSMIATRRTVKGVARSGHAAAIATTLLIPLMAGDRLLGAARVSSPRSPLGFTSDHAALATACGKLAGCRIQRIHELRRLRLLNTFGLRLAATRDTRELFLELYEAARQALPLDTFYVALYDAVHARISYPLVVTGGVTHTPPDLAPLDDGPIDTVIKSGSPLHLARSNPTRAAASGLHLPGGERQATSLHVPLQSRSGPLGVVAVQSSHVELYTDDDIVALETIASHAAVALENAQLLAASRRRDDSIAFLNHLNAALNGVHGVEERCAALDTALQPTFPSDSLLIAGLGAPATGEPPVTLYSRAASPSAERLVRSLVHEYAQAIAGSDQPHVITVDCDDATTLSVALIPLRGESQSTGVLGLVRTISPTSQAWQADELNVLLSAATMAARAIETAQLHARSAHERRSMDRLAEWQRALIRGSEAITHTGDITTLIDTITIELERLLPHRSIAVYIMDEEPDRLTTVRVRYDSMPVDVTMSISLGQGIVGAAVLDGLPLLVNDSHLDERSFYPDGDPADPAMGEHLVAAPLIVNGGTIGAVAISRDGSRPFTDEEFQAFTSFVPHFALVIHTGRLVARNRATHISAIRALTATIDAKDPLTRGHSDRVARYARQIAAEMMLPADEQEVIELAALLHDIGKIGVPDEILSKPGPLNASERATMMEHAAMGAEILRRTNGHEIARLIPLIRHHHEWYQGGGYPDGLSGDDIPLGAAIIAVADAFDTMTTKRPYRDAMPVSAALEEARKYASTQFHPLAVDALTSTIETSSLSFDAGSTFNTSQSAVSHITPVDVRPVSVMYRIAREIASIGDVDGFLRKVVRIISEELRYPTVSILLPVGHGADLIIRADVWEAGASSITGTLVPVDSSICGWVYQTGRVANVGDILQDPRFFPPGMTTVRSELAAPLTVDGAPIGVLNAESPHPHAFSSIDERLFVAIASQLAPAVQLAQVHDDIKRAAQRDGLTGIYNHASFYSRLEDLLSEGERVALFIFDVEGLKRVNDTAGHLAGDSALRRVAATLDLETRPQDIVARYGGDEFAIIVTDVDEATAVEMAMRLQAAVNKLTWGSESEALSISVGVAISGRDGNKATDLVEIADRRMYDVRARERSGGRSSHYNRRSRASRERSDDPHID